MMNTIEKEKTILYYTILMLSLCNIATCKKNIPSLKLIPLTKNLSLEKKISTYKLYALPAILATTLIFNKKHIINHIKQYPCSCIATSCFILNFISDTFTKYQQINYVLNLFDYSKQFNKYIICATAVKNTMKQIATKNNSCLFCEQEFQNIITDKTFLSFQELEQFALNFLHQCITNIHQLHIDYPTDLDEHLYEFYKENITIKETLEIYKNDKELYPVLENFYNNPMQYYHILLTHLNILIKKHLQYMITNQYYLT